MVSVQLSAFNITNCISPLENFEKKSPADQQKSLIEVFKSSQTKLKAASHCIKENKLSEDKSSKALISTFANEMKTDVDTLITKAKLRISTIYASIFKNLAKLSIDKATINGEKSLGRTGFGPDNRITQIEDTLLPALDKQLPKLPENTVNNTNFTNLLNENRPIANYIQQLQETLSQAVSLKDQSSSRITSFNNLYKHETINPKYNDLLKETADLKKNEALKTYNFLKFELNKIGANQLILLNQKERFVKDLNANIQENDRLIQNSMTSATSLPKKQDLINLEANLIQQIQIEKLLKQLDFRKNQVKVIVEEFRTANQLDVQKEIVENSPYYDAVQKNEYESHQKNVTRIKERIETLTTIFNEFSTHLNSKFNQYKSINSDFFKDSEENIEEAKLVALVYFQTCQNNLKDDLNTAKITNKANKILFDDSASEIQKLIKEELKQVEKIEKRISKIETSFSSISNLGQPSAGEVISETVSNATEVVAESVTAVAEAIYATMSAPFSWLSLSTTKVVEAEETKKEVPVDEKEVHFAITSDKQA